MPYFGEYAIAAPVQHNFEKEEGWWWKIKPVDSGMELEMSKFMLHKRYMTVDGQRQELPPTWMEIAFREIALTFGGTNIPKEKDGEEPLLEEGASIAKIENMLAKFPQSMTKELWIAIGKANPGWGPSDPNLL
jgi:hypothetical protein